MSGLLTAQDFSDLVGKAFTPKGQHRVLTLASVMAPALAGWDGLPRQPFALIFHGPAGDLLPEGEYDVTVAGGPDFTLYITPVHTVARDRQDYQSAFN